MCVNCSKLKGSKCNSKKTFIQELDWPSITAQSMEKGFPKGLYEGETSIGSNKYIPIKSGSLCGELVSTSS